MKRLKIETIEKLAKARGWSVDDSAFKDKRIIFIRPLTGLFQGAVMLKEGEGLLKWTDARMKNRLHVHINAYYEWPENKKECVKTLEEIEFLCGEYIVGKAEYRVRIATRMLDDILCEFGHKESISLSVDRIREMRDALKQGGAK